MRRFLVISVVVAFLFLSAASVAAETGDSGQVVGSPTVDIVVPEDDVTAGEENEVEFYLLNEGNIRSSGPPELVDRVTTARATTVEFTSRSDGIDVVTGRVPVGDLPSGESGPFVVRLDVDETADEGDHRLSARVEYRFTRIAEYGTTPRLRDLTRTERERVSVEVREGARFRVEEASTDARLGERGDATVRLRNHGSAEASDAVVTATARGETVRFEDDAESVEAAVGDVPAGDDVTVELPVRFSRDGNVRGQPFDTRVEYEDNRGIEHESRRLTPSVFPDEEQRFEVRNVTSSLRPGSVGVVSGEVVNAGETAVGNVVLRHVGDVRHVGDANVEPRDSSVAVGSLSPDEARSFSVRVEVAAGVSSDKELVFEPEYRHNGDDYVGDRLRLHAPVGEHRDAFDARTVDGSLTQGDETRVAVEVTNRLGEGVRNATVVAALDEPVEIEHGEAYVGDLAEGETEEVVFTVDADSDATPRTYPARLTVEYTDAAGEQRVASAVAPVTVVEDEAHVPFEDGLLAVVVLALLAGLGWWVYGKDFVKERRG